MKLEAQKLEFSNELGNDLSADVDINNLIEETINKIIKDLQQKKETIIREKLKEILGIEIDIEEERKRRFNRLSVEYRLNEEIIYFNDGSVNGKRIVTFVKKDNPINFNNNKFEFCVEYYYY